MSQLSGDLGTLQYAVFDDFPWDRFKFAAKQWLGAQKTFTITDKYRGKKTINWGKPCIFLCNPEDEPDWSSWFRENTVRVFVENKLY